MPMPLAERRMAGSGELTAAPGRFGGVTTSRSAIGTSSPGTWVGDRTGIPVPVLTRMSQWMTPHYP
jgi:hypothetical protein